MTDIVHTVCGCMICLFALGCSCSRDASRPWPGRSPTSVDSQRAESAVLPIDEPDASEDVPSRHSPEEGAEQGEAVGHAEGDRQYEAAESAVESAVPLSGRTEPATDPPEHPNASDVEVIEPASRPARASARDAQRVAADVNRDLKQAESFAERRKFGEACRRLIAAYEKLSSEVDSADEVLSGLKTSVLEKLRVYSEQANRAAGGDSVGSGLGKPLSVK